MGLGPVLQGQTERLDDWQRGHHVCVLGADPDAVYLGRVPQELALNAALRTAWSVARLARTEVEDVRVRPAQLVPFRAESWTSLEHVQHVAIHPDLELAVLSALRPGGTDHDLFLSHRTTHRTPQGRMEIRWSAPLPMDGVNTEGEEVFPHWVGPDLHFAFSSGGPFRVRCAEARHQWLRSEPLDATWNAGGDVCGALEVVQGQWLVASRSETDAPVQVHRVLGEAPPTLGEGWALCMAGDMTGDMAGVLEVRDPQTRRCVARHALGLAAEESGPTSCISMAGLDPTRAWEMRWHPEGGSPDAVEVRLVAPDGRVVRRHVLRAALGWRFTFLPLDPVAELNALGGADASRWPALAVHVVYFDVDSDRPQPASLAALGVWLTDVGRDATAWKGGVWQVSGHADASGGDAHNYDLSVRRAEGVVEHLRARIPGSTVQTVARGSSFPVSDDPAQNRRVEVRWVPNVK
jgi:hypothetical protein